MSVFDARSRDRFSGENENIDPVAGHIPGAVSAPFTGNLDINGNWKSKSELRKLYLELLEGSPSEQAVSYSGSGITACHNILAMYYAGLGDTRLYSGSWSDITQLMDHEWKLRQRVCRKLLEVADSYSLSRIHEYC